MPNGFNGSMRDELLNGESFRTLPEARVVITVIAHSNVERPPQSLKTSPRPRSRRTVQFIRHRCAVPMKGTGQ